MEFPELVKKLIDVVIGCGRNDGEVAALAENGEIRCAPLVLVDEPFPGNVSARADVAAGDNDLAAAIETRKRHKERIRFVHGRASLS